MLKKILKYSFYGFVICLPIGLILLAYTYFVEPYQFVVKEVTINVPNWNKELNGFKVVAISDLHGGSHTVTEERIRGIVEQINAQNPDIIILLGDYVSQQFELRKSIRNRKLKMPMETIGENLKGLKAKYGVFAVIGNHDWWYDEIDCRKVLEKNGFTVLKNETKSFEVSGQTINILGIEDFWRHKTVEITDVFAKLPSKQNTIAITHNPDSFNLTTNEFAILLAGHTHGGQVNFPLIGAPIVPADKEYTAGHVVKDGRHLFVTTGIGTSGLPFRFRVPPEIVVLTLNSEN